jgi:S1-C subfamily serine protease
VRSGVVRIETIACHGSAETGTGILVGPRLVVTVEHVIDSAVSILLKQNGRIVGYGTVVGSDPARDVALVRSDRPISGYRFRFAHRTPALGESVAAIGFPLGLPLTVTRGTVSGNDRTISINGVDRRQLVQTDAPVNPGNSGGPLMTDSGQVVGLVDLGTNRANGLAFAVSAEVAAPLIQGWTFAPQPVSSNCAPRETRAAPTTQAQTAGSSP